MRETTIALHQAVIRDLIVWLMSNHDSNQSITRISNISGYSVGHIQRIFYHHNRITIGFFCRKMKLCRIVNQLKNTDITLSAISHEYNFSSQQSFSHYFKRETGCTPGKCRKKDTCHVCSDFYKIYLE